MVTPHRDIVARFGGARAARGAARHAVRLPGKRGRRSRSARSSTSPSACSSPSRSPASRPARVPIPPSAHRKPRPARSSRLRTADLVFCGPGQPDVRAVDLARLAGARGARRHSWPTAAVAVFSSAAALTRRPLQPSRLRDLQGRPADPLARRPRSALSAARLRGSTAWSSRTSTTPRAAPTTRASATWASGGCALMEGDAARRRLDARRRRAHRAHRRPRREARWRSSAGAALTVRRRGAHEVFPAGARGCRRPRSSARGAAAPGAARPPVPRARWRQGAGRASRGVIGARKRPRTSPHARSPLLGEAARLEQAFAGALQSLGAPATATDADPRARPHHPRLGRGHAPDRRARPRARRSSTRWCIGSARPRPSACAIPARCGGPARGTPPRPPRRAPHRGRPGSSPTASETA